MANSFQVSQYILDDVFVRFANDLRFAKTGNRNLEGDFKSLKYATGQTIDYRLEERYLGGEGATAVTEDRVQITRPLTVDKQFHQMVSYDGFELTFDRATDAPYLEMSLGPRAKRLANMVENYIAQGFYKTSYQATGTPGVSIDQSTVFNTDAYMTELGIPSDGKRYAAVNPRTGAQLSNELYNVFNNKVNTEALMDGFIGELADLNFFKTNFLNRHIAGEGQAGGAPPTGFKLGGVVTSGPISSGNSIVVGSLGQAAGTTVFKEGDIIEVDDDDGVFMINPLNYQTLTQRAQFVVTADVVSADGNTATIPVNPEIVTSGARQNISAAIPNGAQLLLRDDHNVSLAYHSNALIFAAPQLKILKGGVDAVNRTSDLYKLSMTYTTGADIRNYQQLDRIDVLAAFASNPEFLVRVCS